MVSKTTKARLGAKGAVALARHPTLRWVTVRAGVPTAKLGLGVGKIVAKRKARGQVVRLVCAGRTVGELAIIYGPMAAEVFGLVEAPKPKRRTPAFAAGVVIGAGGLYLLTRDSRR